MIGVVLSIATCKHFLLGLVWQGSFRGAPEECGSSKTAPAPLFFTKNASSYKTFGRASPEKPELEPVEAMPNRALKIKICFGKVSEGSSLSNQFNSVFVSLTWLLCCVL